MRTSAKKKEPELLTRSAAAARLSAERDRIGKIWEERVKASPSAIPLSPRVLVDAIPQIIDELIDELNGTKSNLRLVRKEAQTVQEHVGPRIEITDFSLSEVLLEYGLLRESVFQVLEEEHALTAEARDVILHTFDVEITAQQKTERQLRENEERYEFALRAGKIGVWEMDLRSERIIWSDRQFEIFGVDPATKPLTYDIFQQTFHPEDAPKVKKELEDAVREKRDFSLEYRIRKSGAVRWVKADGRVYCDADGQPSRMAGTNIDITDRKEAELALGNEKQKLEIIFNNSPAGMALWVGPNFVFELVNPAFQAIFPERQLVGRPFLEACPEFIGQQFGELIKKVFETGETFIGREILARHPKKPGGENEDVYYDFTYSRVEDAEGKPYGVYNHSIDVSDRVFARRELEESLELFRTVAEAIPQMVWAANPNGEVDYVNERWQEFTGLDFKRSIGYGWEEAIHPEDLSRWQKEFIEGVQNGRTISMERRIRRADGNYVWHLTRAVPVRDEGGKVLKFFGTSTNIDEQKRVQRDLAEVNTLRERFTNTLTHDLRNPLGSAKMSAQIALRYRDDQAKRDRMLHRIVESTDRVEKMIGDFLDVSRIKAGEKFPLNIDACNLKEIASKAMEEQSLVHGDHFSLSAFGQFDGYWSCDGLRRVFDNLLTNAVKYGAQNSPIMITLKELSPDRVCFQVHNFGNELSPEETAGIFEMYHRVSSAHLSGVKGWGIGLTLVKGIVEAHRGNVYVASGKGQGTTFTIELPRDCREQEIATKQLA